MTTWDEPLGRHLPKVGPTPVPWWTFLLGAVLLLGLLAALFGAYVLFKPKAPIVTKALARAERYESIRAVGIEWRRLVAQGEMPPTAEVWKLRGPLDQAEAKNSTEDTLATPPYYVLALPLDPAAQPTKDKVFVRPVLRSPDARYVAATKQMLPSLLEFDLGNEKLSLGTVLVELRSTAPGAENRLIASIASPEDGHPYPKTLQSSLKLKVYDGCLPKGDDPAIAEGILSHPLGDKSKYWLARLEDSLTVIEVGDDCKFNDAKKLAVKPGERWTITQDPSGQPYALSQRAPSPDSAQSLTLWTFAGGTQKFCKQKWSAAFGDKSCDEAEVLAIPSGAVVDLGTDPQAKPFSPLQLVVSEASRGSLLSKGTWHLVQVPGKENLWAFSGCAAPEVGRFRITEQAGCVPVEEEGSLVGSVKILGKEIEFLDPKEKLRAGGELRVKSLDSAPSPGCVVKVVPEPCAP